MSAERELVELVDPLAAAVRTCPAVAGLHGGQFGQATTYLPGRRVVGIGLGSDEIVVGVIGRYPARVVDIAGQVRAAVAAVAPGMAVTVRVEDIALPGEDIPTPVPPPVPAATPMAPLDKPLDKELAS